MITPRDLRPRQRPSAAPLQTPSREHPPNRSDRRPTPPPARSGAPSRLARSTVEQITGEITNQSSEKEHLYPFDRTLLSYEHLEPLPLQVPRKGD